MSYIGNEPIVSATRTITEVTATAGQTVFVANGGYTVGYIDVFLNGAQLQTVDFTATNGSSITLTEAAQVGDVLKLVAWGTFSTSNLVSPSYTGTLTGGTDVVNIGSGQVYKDASGNVGIGTGSPAAKLDVGGAITDAVPATYKGTIRVNSATQTTVESVGGIEFPVAFDGYGYKIQQISSSGACLAFAGRQGSATWTERMRIDSSGNLLVGTTTAAARVTFAGATTSSGAFALKVSNSAGTLLLGARDDGYVTLPQNYNLTTGAAANMWFDASGYPYRSTSSLKYKKNVQDAVHGLTDLMNLRSVTYEGKSETDAGKTFGGLIAEEVHEAGLTEFVQYAEDGTPDALHYGNMVSICIKAIQEQQAIITELKSRVEALENK